MYDFSVRSSPETPSKTAKVKGMASKSCPMHASLREGKSLYSVSQQTVSVGVCAAEARRRLLYTTKSNSLIVEMINVSHINSQSINFVLKYEGEFWKHNMLKILHKEMSYLNISK